MLMYPMKIQPDGDTFVGIFVDIPHGHTDGKDAQDVMRHAPNALKTAISMLMEKGLEVPLPSKASRKLRAVGLPSLIDDAKVELYIAVKASGMRKAELARRMGIHKQQVDRLFDLDHTSRIEQLAAAFAAIGKKLAVMVEAA